MESSHCDCCRCEACRREYKPAPKIEPPDYTYNPDDYEVEVIKDDRVTIYKMRKKNG